MTGQFPDEGIQLIEAEVVRILDLATYGPKAQEAAIGDALSKFRDLARRQFADHQLTDAKVEEIAVKMQHGLLQLLLQKSKDLNAELQLQVDLLQGVLPPKAPPAANDG